MNREIIEKANKARALKSAIGPRLLDEQARIINALMGVYGGLATSENTQHDYIIGKLGELNVIRRIFDDIERDIEKARNND